ncbi:hypothetical protein SMICM17S_07631 [Streptomyces microflavus]
MGPGNVLVGYGTGAPAARRRRIRPERVGAICDRDRSSVCTCACARCGFRPRSRAGSGR